MKSRRQSNPAYDAACKNGNRRVIRPQSSAQSRHGATDLPLISVVTPSHNQAEFIEQTISSVLAQKYPRFEHIVVDGGSADGTLDVLARYPHLHWISETDAGQAAAVNKGLTLAKGEILGWINSDDWYEPGIFHRVARFFSNNPDKHIVMGDCNLVDEHGRTFARIENFERGFAELQRYWRGKSIPTQPAIFFRRELIAEFGLLDESLHYAMDYDLWMRFAREHRFYHINAVAANYRFHSRSKSGSTGDWSRFMPEWKRVHDRYCPPRRSPIKRWLFARAA